MSRCIEIIRLQVRSGREDEFVAIERVRFAEMRRKNPDIERRLFKVPFSQNGFVVCTSWPAREDAIRYAGERFQRERFQKFLRENIDDMSLHFLEEIDLQDMASVPQDVRTDYAG